MVTLNLSDLTARLAVAGVRDPKPLQGGASSLTYAGDRDGTRVVVKVAPPGLAPVLHRDVLRQARLLRALSVTSVPVPEVLFEDPGAPPGVPPLFVMSFLPGDSLEPLYDVGPHTLPASVVSNRLHDAARVMAELHRIDPSDVGLDGESVASAADEIERWCRVFATVDADLVPGWEESAQRLRETLPAASGPAVVHGDFRLGNMLAIEERVTAVIDWEIWSLGDPRVDLGWFLLNADPATYRRSTPYVGHTPSPAELAELYAEARGALVADVAWFQGLAAFKSAATWSLIVKHNRRRSQPHPEHEAMAGLLPDLLDAARRLSGHPG